MHVASSSKNLAVVHSRWLCSTCQNHSGTNPCLCSSNYLKSCQSLCQEHNKTTELKSISAFSQWPLNTHEPRRSRKYSNSTLPGGSRIRASLILWDFRYRNRKFSMPGYQFGDHGLSLSNLLPTSGYSSVLNLSIYLCTFLHLFFSKQRSPTCIGL